MDVQNALGKCLNKAWTENAHEPGKTHQAHPPAFEQVDEASIVSLPVRTGCGVEKYRFDAVFLSPSEGGSVFYIADHDGDFPRHSSLFNAVDDGLKIGSPAGNQYPKFEIADSHITERIPFVPVSK